MVQWLKDLLLFQKPGFNFQNLLGGSRTLETPVPEDPVPLLASMGTGHRSGAPTHVQSKQKEATTTKKPKQQQPPTKTTLKVVLRLTILGFSGTTRGRSAQAPV